MKHCREFRAALRALEDGELALERALALEEHARGCRACGLALARERALTQALLALPQAPLERLDLERNVQAVLARLDAPPAAARRSPLLRLAPFAALAAAAALLALLGWRFLRPEGEPRPAAPLVQEPQPAPAEPLLDTQRLEAARAQVCAALRECAPAFEPAQDEARAFAQAVDVRSAPLAAAGWPLAALVQTAATDPDPLLAARALRWLGLHRGSASRVRGALARPELAASALEALLDLSPEGVDELRRAPDSPGLRTLVLARLERGPEPRLVPWIEEELGRERAATTQRATLLDALVACGEPAVASLLRLADSGALDESLALALLERLPASPHALGLLLDDAKSGGIGERLLLLAVERAGSEAGWERVERAARGGRNSAEALAALARGTPEALAALLRLRAASGAPAGLLETTLERVLRDHPESAAVLAQSGSRSEQAQLFELAGALAAPALVPAFVELAASELLPEPERRFALQLCTEQGRPEDLPALAALFPRLRERTLQAACLIALHALGGPRAVEEALARRAPALRRRVLALLEDPASANRNATTQARLARAIENTLPAPQS